MKPFIRTLPFVPADPLDLWGRVHPHPRHGFFLGSGAATDTDHLIYFSAGEPSRVYQLGSNLRDQAFTQFEQLLRPKIGSTLPRLVGFLGFECGRQFAPGLARLPQLPNLLRTPDAFFGDYPNIVRVDSKKMETTVLASNARQLNHILR